MASPPGPADVLKAGPLEKQVRILRMIMHIIKDLVVYVPATVCSSFARNEYVVAFCEAALCASVVATVSHQRSSHTTLSLPYTGFVFESMGQVVDRAQRLRAGMV